MKSIQLSDLKNIAEYEKVRERMESKGSPTLAP